MALCKGCFGRDKLKEPAHIKAITWMESFENKLINSEKLLGPNTQIEAVLIPDTLLCKADKS